jgi:histidinol-phosphate phosphatase family protein
MSATVFLDKDGTLIQDVPYNVDPDQIRLAPFAGRALRTLAEHWHRVVVVSNQSGVARGYFPESALEAVRERITTLCRGFGVELAGFYYCPHHPDGSVTDFAIECDCRKPGDGMLRTAAADLGVALEDCWMVGDILDDIEAGKRAGCRTILIDNGNETEWRLPATRWPDAVVRNLENAARLVVASSAQEQIGHQPAASRLATQVQLRASA